MALNNVGHQDNFFVGGMDGDSDIKSIAPGDYLYASGMRNKYTESGVDGNMENVAGNRVVSFTLPSGTNKCIGRLEDVPGRTIFYFVWNSNGDHRILRWYPNDIVNPIQVILSGSILNFQEWDYINHINLVGDLLYWTDGINPQRYINTLRSNRTYKLLEFIICFSPQESTSSVQYQFSNTISGLSTTVNYTYPSIKTRVDAAKIAYNQFIGISYLTSRFDIINAGEYLYFTAKSILPNFTVNTVSLSGSMTSWYKPKNYYAAISERDLDVVGWPGWLEPDTELASAPNVSTNYLQGGCYQFAYSVNYDDGQSSVIGKYSRMMYNSVAFGPLKDYTNYSQDFTQGLSDVNSVKISYTDQGRLRSGRQIIKSIDIYVRNDNESSFQKIETLEEWELDGIYYFFNTQKGATISNNLLGRYYDNIPITSRCQEVVNNKLFYLDNKLGYDNVPFPGRVVPGQRARTEAFLQVPLSLGRYRFGVIYFDRFGRNNFVQTNPTLDTTIFFPPANPLTTVNYVQWTIPKEFQPPVWATHYAWVRTKELTSSEYFPVTSSVVTYKNAAGAPVVWGNNYVGNTEIRTAEITCSYPLPTMQYSKFSQGDQVLFYQIGGGSYSCAVVEYDDTTKVLKFEYNVAVNPNLLEINTVVNISRIYAPSKQSEEQAFYEFYECYPVINPGQSNRAHAGGTGGTDQVLNTTNATGRFIYGWDSFIHKIDPTVNGVTYAESYFPVSSRATLEKVTITTPVLSGGRTRGVSGITVGRGQSIDRSTGGEPVSAQRDPTKEFVPNPPTIQTEEDVILGLIRIDGIGRVNVTIQDNKQVNLRQNIVFSSVYNVGTNYNGFGTFNLLSTGDLPIGFGSINRAQNIDNILLCIMDNKCFSVYIDKGILQGQDGSQTISVSGQVIGAYRDLKGIHGTINPESFAMMDGLAFWWDAYRGEVCQYGSDGITPVSAYKMNTPFAIKGREAIKVYGPQYKVLGAIHKWFSEYLITFPSYAIDGVVKPAETLVFNFDDNRWKGYMPFTPEMMTGFAVGLITFKNGRLWVHDSNTKNNFYGVQYASEVQWVVNTAEKTDKNMVSISIESNQAPIIPEIITPPSEWNINGQLSELLGSDFELINNSYWASFLCNKNTPNIASPVIALNQGEPLLGQVMNLKLSNPTPNSLILRSSRVYFNTNELTN